MFTVSNKGLKSRSVSLTAIIPIYSLSVSQLTDSNAMSSSSMSTDYRNYTSDSKKRMYKSVVKSRVERRNEEVYDRQYIDSFSKKLSVHDSVFSANFSERSSYGAKHSLPYIEKRPKFSSRFSTEFEAYKKDIFLSAEETNFKKICHKSLKGLLRASPALYLEEDFILIFGGVIDNITSNGVFLFSPTSQTWVICKDMPEHISYGAAVLLDNKVYVTGGYLSADIVMNETFASASTYSFCLRTNTWHQCANMREKRACHAMVAVDKNLYVFGGQSEDGSVLDSVERYKPSSDQWERICNMPQPRMGLCAINISDQIWIIGGTCLAEDMTRERVCLSSVWSFDPLLTKWTQLSDLPTPRAYCAAVHVDNSVYILGGGQLEPHEGLMRLSSISDVNYFDGVTHDWTVVTTLFFPLHGLTAVQGGNKIYAIGGINTTMRTACRTLDVIDLYTGLTEHLTMPMNISGCSAVYVPFKDKNLSESPMLSRFQSLPEHFETDPNWKVYPSYGSSKSMNDIDLQVSSNASSFGRKSSGSDVNEVRRRGFSCVDQPIYSQNYKSIDKDNAVLAVYNMDVSVEKQKLKQNSMNRKFFQTDSYESTDLSLSETKLIPEKLQSLPDMSQKEIKKISFENVSVPLDSVANSKSIPFKMKQELQEIPLLDIQKKKDSLTNVTIAETSISRSLSTEDMSKITKLIQKSAEDVLIRLMRSKSNASVDRDMNTDKQKSEIDEHELLKKELYSEEFSESNTIDSREKAEMMKDTVTNKAEINRRISKEKISTSVENQEVMDQSSNDKILPDVTKQESIKPIVDYKSKVQPLFVNNQEVNENLPMDYENLKKESSRSEQTLKTTKKKQSKTQLPQPDKFINKDSSSVDMEYEKESRQESITLPKSKSSKENISAKTSHKSKTTTSKYQMEQNARCLDSSFKHYKTSLIMDLNSGFVHKIVEEFTMIGSGPQTHCFSNKLLKDNVINIEELNEDKSSPHIEYVELKMNVEDDFRKKLKRKKSVEISRTDYREQTEEQITKLKESYRTEFEDKVTQSQITTDRMKKSFEFESETKAGFTDKFKQSAHSSARVYVHSDFTFEPDFGATLRIVKQIQNKKVERNLCKVITGLKRSCCTQEIAVPVILSIGGLASSGNGSSILLYKHLADEWQFAGNMPESRAYHSTVLLGVIIYVTGGFNISIPSEEQLIATDSVIAYNIRERRWRRRTSMLNSRVYHSAAIVNGEMFVFGGRNKNGEILSSVEVYSEMNNKWKYRQPLPYPVMGAAVSIIDSCVYVIGGVTSVGKIRRITPNVSIYNPILDRWSIGPSLHYPIAYTSATTNFNCPWLYGGLTISDDFVESFSAVLALDRVKENWNIVGQMTRPRHAVNTVAVETCKFVLGGVNSSSQCAVDDNDLFLSVEQSTMPLQAVPVPLLGASTLVLPSIASLVYLRQEIDKMTRTLH